MNNFLANAFGGGATQVTLVTTLIHGGDEPVTDLRNFNYSFNSKEMTTLLIDSGYDSDTTDPNNPLGSPHSSKKRANSRSVSGVCSAGLMTMVQPAQSAGASFHAAISSG